MEEADWEEEEEDEQENEEKWNEPVESDLKIRDGGLQEACHSPNVADDGKPNVSGARNDSIVSRMALNDNKAGMDGLDKERINKIILEASKGSRFYENERKKEAQVNQRIDRMKQQLAGITQQHTAAALVEVDDMAAELEASRDFSRSIVHLDMDAFYAAVEMRDDPALKDKPMAVGGMSMLSTSNYHARRYGVRAAMPGFIAKKLCPELVIVGTSFDKYRAVSAQVRDVLGQYDPNFCPASLDEAYFDLTEHLERRREFPESERTFEYGDWNRQQSEPTDDVVRESGRGVDAARVQSHGQVSEPETLANEEILPSMRVRRDIPSSTNAACRCAQSAATDTPGASSVGASQTESSTGHRAVGAVTSRKTSRTFGFSVEEAVEEIRFRIEQKTQLTASAGIAPNVMLAKICSDKNKPNGQYRIQPNREAVMAFMQQLPIRKVSGIGKVTERMLSALDIRNCADLYQQRALLHLLFSQISSHHFLRISLGLGSTRVERDAERKSMSTERTFRELHQPADLYSKCSELCQALAEDLQNGALMGKTVTIKLKTVKFEVKTKACSVPTAINSADCLFSVAKDLLRAEINACKPEPLRLRLMGVRLSNLQPCAAVTNKQGSITEFFKKCQLPAAPSRLLQQAKQETENGGHQEKSSSLSIAGDAPPDVHGERERPNVAATPSRLEPQPSTSEIPLTDARPSNATTGRSRAARDVSADAVGASEFLCPVCNVPQLCVDLESFNDHVDVCLNRGAIRDMLKREASEDIPTTRRSSVSPTKGKRSSSGPKSAAKRRKQEKTHSNTLDKFFT